VNEVERRGRHGHQSEAMSPDTHDTASSLGTACAAENIYTELRRTGEVISLSKNSTINYLRRPN